MRKLNDENTGTLWKVDKELNDDAMTVLLNHPWRGNVRELQNTILRLCILSKDSTITKNKVLGALLILNKMKSNETILNRPLGNGFSLPKVLSQVAQHYLRKALAESSQNKTQAAKLIDLPNYQTLDNWLIKYNCK